MTFEDVSFFHADSPQTVSHPNTRPFDH